MESSGLGWVGTGTRPPSPGLSGPEPPCNFRSGLACPGVPAALT